MKKKGFTLIEILAVVVILGLLVIIVMPNVLDMFKEAKQKTFESELKEIYRVAQQQWIRSEKDDTKVFARNKNEKCDAELELSGRNSVDYYIQLDKDGNIVRYYASDGDYQYQYVGKGLKIADIENSLEISKVTSANRISVSCNTRTGDYYYTSSIHQSSKTGPVMFSNINMYQTYNETGSKYFLRYLIDGYNFEDGSNYYCIVGPSGFNSCDIQGIYYETVQECNFAISSENLPSASYTCKEETSTSTTGFVNESIIGFEKNGKVYYLDRSEGFDKNQSKLTNIFGAASCESVCSDKSVLSNMESDSNSVMNITPSKMNASDTCPYRYSICMDSDKAIIYSDSEVIAVNSELYGNIQSLWDEYTFGYVDDNSNVERMAAYGGYGGYYDTDIVICYETKNRSGCKYKYIPPHVR